MTSKAESMKLLLKAIGDEQVDRNLINVNQLRKWMESEEEELKSQISKIWGSIRSAGNGGREKVVAQTLKLLNSGSQGSYSKGQAVFERVCAQCHKFRGGGAEVGPEITANGRGNLEQLASNILDPSLVIGEAFQAQTVLTLDGKMEPGIVVEDSERFLRLKVQGGKTVEFNKDDIDVVRKSSQSLMPEGVEVQMKPQELLDLFAYLVLLKPLGEPDNKLISGTPADFVQP